MLALLQHVTQATQHVIMGTQTFLLAHHVFRYGLSLMLIGVQHTASCMLARNTFHPELSDSRVYPLGRCTSSQIGPSAVDYSDQKAHTYFPYFQGSPTRQSGKLRPTVTTV
jgi:hypothetical protein